MKRFILSSLITLFFPILSLGQTVQKSETDILTENYNKAVERSTAHLTTTYKSELQKLLEKYSKKGDVKEVEKIAIIIKNFDSASKEINSETMLHFLKNKQWKTIYGTVLKFLPDETGEKTNIKGEITHFVWKLIDEKNKTIQITSRINKDSPLQTEYIVFVSTDVAKIGSSLNGSTTNLIRVD